MKEMKALEILKTLREDHTYDHIVSYDASMKEVKEAISELEALQQRSCEGCKYLDKGTHGICPIAEPLMRQWLNYDEATFCCNRYEPKE